jgi:hypothetical protein
MRQCSDIPFQALSLRHSLLRLNRVTASCGYMLLKESKLNQADCSELVSRDKTKISFQNFGQSTLEWYSLFYCGHAVLTWFQIMSFFNRNSL